jgi:quercetin dioxygenase-like cupin family protein
MRIKAFDINLWRSGSMHRTLTSAIVIGAAGLITATALAQTPPARTPPLRYIASPLEGDATREVRLQSVTLPPGGGNTFHRHPGDQWVTVQEGEILLIIRGQEPRKLKTGEAVHIPRGVIHRNQNDTDKPARTVELVIVDKDKPPTEQVPD